MTTPKDIAETVQAALSQGGFYGGRIDGILGPKSDRAYADLKEALKGGGGTEAWPKQDRASMSAFYGDPDADGNGKPDRSWEAKNLVSITPPYRMVLAWDTKSEVRTIKVHRRCADSLLRILNAIKDHYGSQEAIEVARMHLYGGVYNFRMTRGGSRLSIHSWAAAIDLDPERNGFGVPYREGKGMMPKAVIEIFQAEGWVWGGPWRTADAMHFQAARI